MTAAQQILFGTFNSNVPSFGYSPFYEQQSGLTRWETSSTSFQFNALNLDIGGSARVIIEPYNPFIVVFTDKQEVWDQISNSFIQIFN